MFSNLKRYLFFMPFFLTPMMPLFASNRVLDEAEPLVCTVTDPQNKKMCPDVNQKAKNDGCITEDERVSLNEKLWTVLCNGKTLLNFCNCCCPEPPAVDYTRKRRCNGYQCR